MTIKIITILIDLGSEKKSGLGIFGPCADEDEARQFLENSGWKKSSIPNRFTKTISHDKNLATVELIAVISDIDIRPLTELVI
jgi:hypothetical protein